MDDNLLDLAATFKSGEARDVLLVLQAQRERAARRWLHLVTMAFAGLFLAFTVWRSVRLFSASLDPLDAALTLVCWMIVGALALLLSVLSKRDSGASVQAAVDELMTARRRDLWLYRTPSIVRGFAVLVVLGTMVVWWATGVVIQASTHSLVVADPYVVVCLAAALLLPASLPIVWAVRRARVPLLMAEVARLELFYEDV